ncbi:MAG: 2-hydroxyacyl-CoA dehydratase [Proteobacteria bacterium]|nr:2-hydroxyacyl-CoA dehydratase [Pseudomonadota bacterium]
MDNLYLAGIDIGSTTAKMVFCDPSGRVIFSRYRRHHALTVDTLRVMLTEARRTLGNCILDLAFTGSAGMGVAESYGFPFIQEVVASIKLIRQRWPDVRTLIEIGGEDSKIAFFDDRFQPDIRMNGNCAGDTGAFIEQTAVLLNEPIETLNRLVERSQALHPIASRCGVFAKTDIQALLSNRVSREDIAASVFHAIALQVISTLACGRDIREKVLFAGGPLTFFPCLREAFCRLLHLDPENGAAACEHPELIAAEGAALHHGDSRCRFEVEKWLQILAKGALHGKKEAGKRLAPLFRDREEFAAWEERHREHRVQRVDIGLLDQAPCFLGIDSGSTTTKILLMDGDNRVAFTWYAPNGGDPIGAVRKGIDSLRESCREAGALPRILRTAVTGYGEDLVRAAFALDDGVVETMTHYRAALTARRNHLAEPEAITTFPGIDGAVAENAVTKRESPCAGCENRCTVVRMNFGDKRNYFTGNRCERHFSNGSSAPRPGENLFATRLKLVFDRPLEPDGPPLLTFGIPRALNLYENFPFWCALLTHCGFRVVLSAPSGAKLFEKGVGSVMSDNICFPGKLAHGHILDLIEKGVDRIFYPIVVFESREDPDARNSFNCPVVTGYPDVVRSAIDPEGRFGVPIDSPVVSFKDTALLKKQLHLFLKAFGIGKKRVAEAVERGLEAQREVRRALQKRAAALMEHAREEQRFVMVVSGRPYHSDPLINHGLPELLAGFGVDVIPENAVPLAADGSLKESSVLTQWAYTNRILSVAKAVAHTPHIEMLQITSFGCGLDAISADEVREIIQGEGKIYSLIKMDEITNLGAVRVRLRSMLEAIRERSRTGKPTSRQGRGDHPSGQNSEGRTILIPWFSPLYSPFIPAVFASLGCRVELLAPQDRSSVDVGLRYVNNDMCYPAVILIGDIIKAFQSRKHDPEKTTVLLIQTFGQCRASNYLPLTRKALASAGFGSVPVISLSAEETHPRSGLPIDRKKLVKRLALGLIFSDALARITLATAPHEIRTGSSMALQQKYIAETGRLAGEGNFEALLQMLREAVRDFNALPVDNATVPVVGVLGEIFVKHNAFSNNNIVDWLISQGVEVVVPPLLTFFEQRFVNEEFDQRACLKRSFRDLVTTRLTDRYVRFYMIRVERVMKDFRYYRRHYDLNELAEETSRATSLANQAGEGWLLPAEMIALLKGGVANIVCLQPFGCLANHIIGKGVEKKLKFLYNRLNLLFLDMDPGMSEVNILNRLHFIVMSAREGMVDEDRNSLPLPLIPSRQGRGILGFSPFKGEAGGDGIV